jgi:hypothetical protein
MIRTHGPFLLPASLIVAQGRMTALAEGIWRACVRRLLRWHKSVAGSAEYASAVSLMPNAGVKVLSEIYERFMMMFG